MTLAGFGDSSALGELSFGGAIWAFREANIDTLEVVSDSGGA